MRIISGKYRGKQINPPKNITIRPTTDFAKVGLFNILVNHFDLSAISVLDLFSGTGSISYEFASRDCPSIIAVESDFRQYEFIRNTANKLNFNQLKIFKLDAIHFIKNCKQQFDVVFADPPYNFEDLSIIPDLIFDNNLIKHSGLFVLEHSKNNTFTNHENFYNHRSYGSVNFTIFRNK